MGVALSVLRRCLCLDDDNDDDDDRLRQHNLLSSYARVAEPPAASTPLSMPVRSAPAIARSRATQPLFSAHQPAVATSVTSSSRISAPTHLTGGRDSAPRHVGPSTSITSPTPGLSTSRHRQAQGDYRGTSSGVVSTHHVTREISADNCGLSDEVRARVRYVVREANADLLARAVSTHDGPSSPIPAISSKQLLQVQESSRSSTRFITAHVRDSTLLRNSVPPAISTPQCSQATVTVGSTLGAVLTLPVKRELTSEPLSASTALSMAVRSAPATALSTATQPFISAQHLAVATSATSSSRFSAPAHTTGAGDPASGRVGPTSTTRRSQAPIVGGSSFGAVGTSPLQRELGSDVSRAPGAHDVYGLSEKISPNPVSAGTESRKTQTLQHRWAQQSNQSRFRVEKRAVPKMHKRRAGNGSPTPPIPVYEIPPYLKDMIKLDNVPCVLKETLSDSNYSEYFACLLYAEDFYLEKWSEYILKEVSLQIHKRSSHDKYFKNGVRYSKLNELKDYVAFEIDSIPERRPYILSRDFVFLQPLASNCQRIQGRVVRVQKSTIVLAEFEDDFWLQHSSDKRYNVSFSFNRVCLKRAHHAVANALGPVLFGFLFPKRVHKAVETKTSWSPSRKELEIKQAYAVSQILDLKGSPPYVIEGPPSMEKHNNVFTLTKTGITICEATIQVYRACNNCRILICTPRNITCDTLMIELSKEISESEQFRANAAFRDYDEVPGDILPSCQFNDEDQCFICPPLYELQAFKIVTSTYMSSFRLRRAGIKPGHFTHIFLVDASSVAEPEAVVPLAYLASEDAAVVISGSKRGSPWYVRSDMARRWGLSRSYFNRLLEGDLYKNDPFICRLSEER